METLKEWQSREDIKKYTDAPISDLLSLYLNRDPTRAILVAPHSFLSPADGFLLYAKIVQPGEQVIFIKGEDYTTESLLREEVKYPCLVIGIFMTSLDVHINRMPTNGFINYTKLVPLKVQNLSMRPIESGILEELGLDYQQLNYAVYNERVKNRIFHPQLRQHYWLIQIADFEVDVIAHFEEQQNRFFTQGERFSLVRMGSQVDLIIPLINPRIQFESLVGDSILSHVEAGIDTLVRWKEV